jgi:hypothetical protein
MKLFYEVIVESRPTPWTAPSQMLTPKTSYTFVHSNPNMYPQLCTEIYLSLLLALD